MEGENTQQTPAVIAPAQNYAIPFAIVIAGLAIAGAIYFSGEKGITPAQEVTSIPPVTKADHILGDPNAKIIIVEYSDTECPYCKTFHPTMQRIMSEYGKDSKVAWVYRQFPIASLHPKAHYESQATECAAKLGGNTKFWEYLDKVFELTPGNNRLDEAELPKIAESVGLDVPAFNKCLTSGEMKAVVDAQMAGGSKAGVTGTPYPIVLIDKKVAGTIGGALPYEDLKRSIDATLAEQK
ncbi:MAG: DsbA family protein [Candidatus Pacebacteria bacterium]|nr:DsbA family protein [Candidatus Paceibacterota bacterium]